GRLHWRGRVWLRRARSSVLLGRWLGSLAGARAVASSRGSRTAAWSGVGASCDSDLGVLLPVVTPQFWRRGLVRCGLLLRRVCLSGLQQATSLSPTVASSERERARLAATILSCSPGADLR